MVLTLIIIAWIILAHAEIDDIIKLVSVLTYIDEQLNDLFKIIFEEEMEHAKSPENIMQQLLSEIELEDMVRSFVLFKKLV